jgi:prepilin-type N-terminal cleavage/methylation domain-containing protein
MLRFYPNQRGFSLAEVLIVIALLGILSSVVLLNLGGSDTAAKERTLKGNLQALRSSVKMYRSDHGRYPCSTGDYDYPCTDQQFRYKLIRFSRADGRTSATKNSQYTYGPYLDDFPEEPFSASDSLTWSIGTERLKATIANVVDGSSGDGGWYYEPESGNVTANLGSAYPNEYAGF